MEFSCEISLRGKETIIPHHKLLQDLLQSHHLQLLQDRKRLSDKDTIDHLRTTNLYLFSKESLFYVPLHPGVIST